MLLSSRPLARATSPRSGRAVLKASPRQAPGRRLAIERSRQLGAPVRPQERSNSLVVCNTASGVTAAAEAPAPLPDPSTGAYVGKKAVVVGAGPAGSTVAMFLAQQGFQVEVYEQREEPRLDKTIDTGRAYIIILIPRGRSALEELRIPLPTDESVQYKGTVRHSFKGQVSTNREVGNVTFSRSGLAQFLIDEARKRYPNRIRFFFNAAVDKVDFEAQKVKFAGLGGGQFSPNSVEAKYDLLVGTDGVASKVRAALQEAAPASDPVTVDVSDSGREYKVYIRMPGDIEPPAFKPIPGTALHLFTSNDPFTTFTAHSNPDGTYTGTFSLQTGAFVGLKTVDDYAKILTERFKGIPADWVAPISQQLFNSQPSSAGKRIRCSRIHGPRTVLLGDAAHAVTPVFGQGANSALESCRILNEVLTEAKGDLDAVPARFDTTRKADVHALYELDRKAYSFFRRKGPLDPDFMQLLGHVILGTILSKIVPFLYGAKPKLLQLGSRTRYSEILQQVERDAAAAGALLLALVVVLALKTTGML